MASKELGETGPGAREIKREQNEKKKPGCSYDGWDCGEDYYWYSKLIRQDADAIRVQLTALPFYQGGTFTGTITTSQMSVPPVARGALSATVRAEGKKLRAYTEIHMDNVSI